MLSDRQICVKIELCEMNGSSIRAIVKARPFKQRSLQSPTRLYQKLKWPTSPQPWGFHLSDWFHFSKSALAMGRWSSANIGSYWLRKTKINGCNGVSMSYVDNSIQSHWPDQGWNYLPKFWTLILSLMINSR